MDTRVSFIGGGFSSLCLAALLAKKGYCIDIYEQSKSIGGYAQKIDIDGYSFTLGPRYLWDFGKGDIGSLFFEYLGLFSHTDFGRLENDCFDEIYLGPELIMQVPMGWDRYRQRLLEHFPKEKAGINRFFDTCQSIYDVFLSYINNNLDYKGYSALLSYIFHGAGTMRQLNLLRKYALKKLQREFDACSLSPVVRSILSAHLAIVVESPRDLSLAAYAVSTLNYHRGSYYPKQHMHSLVDSLVESIEKNGGTFHLNNAITSMKVCGGKISSLATDDGKTFETDLVISNIDPVRTLELIENVPTLRKKRWYERSNSLLSFFIGCEIEDLDSFPFGRAQKWYLRDETVMGKRIFSKSMPDTRGAPEYLYLNSPSTFSDFGQLGPTKKSRVVTGFTPCSYAFLQKMTKEDLEQFQTERRESLVEVIEKNLWPDISRAMRSFSLLTPLDNSRQLLAPEGHIYGKRFRPEDIFFHRVRFDSPISNLKFCSAFSCTPGLASCIRGACYLYEKISGVRLFCSID